MEGRAVFWRHFCSGDEVEARLPVIVGGSNLAVVQGFQIITPKNKHPATEEWERAFRILALLL